MKVYFRILMNRTKLVDLLLKKRMSTISMKRNNTIFILITHFSSTCCYLAFI